jgi:NADH:ubiquinone reductase (non-electrogenic)
MSHEIAQDALAPIPHVYALGDVCANPRSPLPALAQASL